MNSSEALRMYKHNLQMGTVVCGTGGGEGARIRTGKSRVSVSSEHLPFCNTPALEAHLRNRVITVQSLLRTVNTDL